MLSENQVLDCWLNLITTEDRLNRNCCRGVGQKRESLLALRDVTATAYLGATLRMKWPTASL